MEMEWNYQNKIFVMAYFYLLFLLIFFVNFGRRFYILTPKDYTNNAVMRFQTWDLLVKRPVLP